MGLILRLIDPDEKVFDRLPALAADLFGEFHLIELGQDHDGCAFPVLLNMENRPEDGKSDRLMQFLFCHVLRKDGLDLVQALFSLFFLVHALNIGADRQADRIRVRKKEDFFHKVFPDAEETAPAFIGFAEHILVFADECLVAARDAGFRRNDIPRLVKEGYIVCHGLRVAVDRESSFLDIDLPHEPVPVHRKEMQIHIEEYCILLERFLIAMAVLLVHVAYGALRIVLPLFTAGTGPFRSVIRARKTARQRFIQLFDGNIFFMIFPEADRGDQHGKIYACKRKHLTPSDQKEFAACLDGSSRIW